MARVEGNKLDVFSPSEAARVLGLSAETVRELCNKGTLTPMIGPGGQRLIPRESVEELARVRRQRSNRGR